MSPPSGASSVRDDNAGACNSGEVLSSPNEARPKSKCASEPAGARPVRPRQLSVEKLSISTPDEGARKACTSNPDSRVLVHTPKGGVNEDILAAKSEGGFDKEQLEREDHAFFETVGPALK